MGRELHRKGGCRAWQPGVRRQHWHPMRQAGRTPYPTRMWHGAPAYEAGSAAAAPVLTSSFSSGRGAVTAKQRTTLSFTCKGPGPGPGAGAGLLGRNALTRQARRRRRWQQEHCSKHAAAHFWAWLGQGCDAQSSPKRPQLPSAAPAAARDAPRRHSKGGCTPAQHAAPHLPLAARQVGDHFMREPALLVDRAAAGQPGDAMNGRNERE